MALGNTPKVAGRNYMAPGENAQRNWKFMGEVLTQELLTRTIGATERTPAGGCSDPTNGQYAPKRDGKTCFDFLSCLRCRNYVVTGDDLYKLYSFYWRVLLERDRMDARVSLLVSTWLIRESQRERTAARSLCQVATGGS